MQARTWPVEDSFKRNRRDVACNIFPAIDSTASAPDVRKLRQGDHSAPMNFTHTGDPTSRTFPVGVNRPVFTSIRNTTILSDF